MIVSLLELLVEVVLIVGDVDDGGDEVLGERRSEKASNLREGGGIGGEERRPRHYCSGSAACAIIGGVAV